MPDQEFIDRLRAIRDSWVSAADATPYQEEARTYAACADDLNDFLAHFGVFEFINTGRMENFDMEVEALVDAGLDKEAAEDVAKKRQQQRVSAGKSWTCHRTMPSG